MRTKLKVDQAHSMDNGIIFYSKRHKGYVSISTVDEFGNINAEWITMKEYKKGKNNLVEIMEYLKKNNIKYNKIYSERPTLNDVFLELTGKELRD